MDYSFELKDGRKAKIEIWGLEQIEKLLDIYTETYERGMNIVFENFTYLGPIAIDDLDTFDSRRYISSENLTDIEIQEDMDLLDKEYHKAVVALCDDVMVGIIVCDWINDWSYPFWCYHIKLIDVHEKYRNLGIGTNLMESLNMAEFLENKILQRGISSEEGAMYIRYVANRELKGENYAVIPYDYRFKTPPKAIGKYDAFGELVKV